MSEDKNLILSIKIVHTLIWFLFNVVLIVAIHEAYIGRFHILFYTSIFLILIEVMILMINNWECPLTTLAKRYTKKRQANFDIFLPEIVAKYNKEIYTTIIIISFILIAIKNLI